MKPKIKITLNAPAVLFFAGLCFAATLLNEITAGKSNVLLFITYCDSLANPMTYVRFFTHVLGHAGWEHFVGNMAYILLLGPMLEEKHGSKRIIEVILMTALITALINFLFFKNALCGASGVCFAFILMASFTSFKEREIPITFLLTAFIYIGQQVYDGLLIRDNISNMAHIVGGIVGAVTGFTLNRRD